MVLMFLKKKEGGDFWGWSVRFWGEWDKHYFFGSISVMVFWGARKLSINPCRTLVPSYACVGCYQNKISNVTNCSSWSCRKWPAGIRGWWGGCGDQGRLPIQRQPSRWTAEGGVGFNKSSISDVIIDVVGEWLTLLSAVNLSFATGSVGSAYLLTRSTIFLLLTTIRDSVIL